MLRLPEEHGGVGGVEEAGRGGRRRGQEERLGVAEVVYRPTCIVRMQGQGGGGGQFDGGGSGSGLRGKYELQHAIQEEMQSLGDRGGGGRGGREGRA